MKLMDWKEEAGLSYEKIGKLIGSQKSHVFKIMRGEVLPKADLMIRIRSASSGAVTCDDIVDGVVAYRKLKKRRRSSKGAPAVG